MKEWFKARNVWGATILALPDDEAGRIAKAIWAYTMNGELMPLGGAEKGIFPMILLTLQQDEERESDISAKRSIAAKSMHLQANASKSIQMQANDGKCQQMQANADNKNKNKNIDKEQESESEFIADAEAREIQNDHNRVLDAAEDAGFKMSNDVRASLIALYAQYGLVKVLDGLSSCSEHGVANLAYLRAVLRGDPKKQKPKVTAQDFQQRDYSDVDRQLISDLDRELAEFKAKEVG